MSELNENGVDPDQTSDLGLHCLPMSLLWDARLEWVKTGTLGKFSAIYYKGDNFCDFLF